MPAGALKFAPGDKVAVCSERARLVPAEVTGSYRRAFDGRLLYTVKIHDYCRWSVGEEHLITEEEYVRLLLTQ